VSAVLNPFGHPARLRKAFEKRLFEVVVSEPILCEIADVLSRPKIKDKYGITETNIRELLILIEEHSDHVLVSGNITVCRDQDDDLVIETAVKGNVKYLVSGDNDLMADTKVSNFLSSSDIFPVSVAEFLNIIEQRSPDKR